METKKNILQLGDIKLLVDSFYGKVRQDKLLAPVFNNKIGNKWPEHLERMYRFWETILLGEHTYFGSPFSPHAKLPVEKEHFDHWLVLFHQTVDEYFTGKKAEEAKFRAERMAEMFYFKIEYYRNNPSNPIV